MLIRPFDSISDTELTLIDNPNQDLAVRAVIVILERQLLQMRKQIFSDIHR